MSLTTKVIATVLVVTTLAFTVGLLSRNFIVNPRLVELESKEDLSRIERFESEIQRQVDDLTRRADRLAVTINLLATAQDFRQRAFSDNIATAAGLDDLDLFLVKDGAGTAVYPGRLAGSELFNNKNVIKNTLLEHVLYEKTANIGRASGLINIGDTALMYAAVTPFSEPHNGALPGNAYVMVREISPPLVKTAAQAMSVDVQVLSRDAFAKKLAEDSATIGVRTADSEIYWRLLNETGRPVAHLRIKVPPWTFTNAVWVPEIILPLLFTTVIYTFLVLLLRRQVISPVVKIRNTLREIREHHDYTQRVSYPSKDELGDLADECNDLICHVEDYTNELREQTQFDALTGIPNRRWFELELARRWQEAQENQTRLAVILFDVDFFKRYNDYHGHEAGNRVLTDLAVLLDNLLEEPEHGLARIGGQEFAAIIDDTPQGRAANLANAAVDVVLQMGIPHGTNPQDEVLTVSCGVASLLPRAGIEPDILLKQAGRSLHQAKKAGRNQSVDFSGAQVLSISS